MKYDLSRWPEIDLESIRSLFCEVPLEAYPELAVYSRADIHDGLAGQGGLFLASDMAKLLRLKKGMKVMDLGCGAGTTSLFLARNYGVSVYAIDRSPPDNLLRRARDLGVGNLICPIRTDCRQLPFSADYFDAVFSILRVPVS